MRKRTCGFIIGMGLLITLSAIDACGWGGSRGGGRAGFRGGHDGFYHGYGYFGAGPYWPYWYGFTPCVGTFVGYLPYGCTAVVVDGTTYYYYGGYFFSPYSNGYVIVPEPVASTTSQTQEPLAAVQSSASSNQTIAANAEPTSSDTTTINVPNSKGGFTPVRLVRHKNGYVGPQGEFYTGHPTVDALKALYGD